MNGTEDDVLLEEDIKENSFLVKKGLAVTSKLSDVFVNFCCNNILMF
jgi:hypothetical protein